MEATPLSLAKSALDSLLSVAKSLLADEIALQMGVERDLAFIRDEFATMQAALRDADERQSQSVLFATWVSQVRELAIGAEDCLQEFAAHLGKNSTSSSWWCSPCASGARHRIGTMLKELRARVEDVSQRNLRYHLIHAEADDSRSGVRIPGTGTAGSGPASQDEQQRYRKVDLAQLLLKSPLGLRLGITSVWSASNGEDRAAVVREAYDDPSVCQAFPCRAWVTLARPFSLIGVIGSMLRQFYTNSPDNNCWNEDKISGSTFGDDDSGNDKTVKDAITGIRILKRMAVMSECEIVAEFAKHVNKSRYLIVLDDVAQVDEWDLIRTYLPDKNNGSQVVVSTQRADIARLCSGKPLVQSQVHNVPSPHDHQPVYLFFKEEGSNSSAAGSSTAYSQQTEGYRSAQKGDGLAGRGRWKEWVKMAIASAGPEESEFAWWNNAKSNLLDLIRKVGSSDLTVFSVWGIGGAGKTTLVRSIYRELIDSCDDKEEYEDKFEKHAWLTVQHPFVGVDFLRNLLLQLRLPYAIQDETVDMGLSDLMQQACNLLEGKRYLIVLDDISSKSEWNWISPCFPREDTASCIVITTREEEVAKNCSQEKDIYELKALEKEQALELFKQKVFYTVNETAKDVWSKDIAMMEQANLILEKCHGLPLLITSLGRFLASKPKTANEWKKLNDHISAELQTNPNFHVVKTVLSSSYDGLPYHLKPCFLYLSIFPKDHKITKKRFVRRWIAEGYSREMHGRTAKETAEKYFMELVSRSMIQPSKSISGAGSNSGQIVFYRIHDLIREISISKSQEDNLVFILDNGCSMSRQQKVRHLAISSSWRRNRKFMERILDLSCTRSMTVFGKWEPFFLSMKMSFLRVLDLEDTEGLQDQHLEPVGKLYHLKYLSLRGSRGVYQLPDSFGNLSCLETLDIRGTYVTKLPGSIIKLRMLKYLRAGRIAIDDNPPSAFKISDIPLEFVKHFFPSHKRTSASGEQEADLVQFPSFCTKISVLRNRLSMHGIEVPSGLKKLQDLRTLGVININVSAGKDMLKELRELTELRKLSMTGVSKDNRNELCSAISRFSRLESLTIRSEGTPGLEGCLGAVSQYPWYLQSLKLYGNLAELPSWIEKLRYLEKLNLRSTRLKYDAIPILGSLQNLTILRLWRNSFKGGVLDFGDGFPSLVVLELVDLDDLVLVKYGEDAAHKLEQLVVCDCWSIDRVGISGLSFLKALRNVTIKGAYYKRLKESLEQQLGKDKSKTVLKMEHYIQQKEHSKAQKYLRTRVEE